MRSKVLFTLTLATLAWSAITAAAQKPAKAAATPRLNVFNPTVYAIEPNIEVVLNFTDEQKQKLAKAFQETVRSPAIAELRPKKGEAVDKAKQAKLKEEMAKAQAELAKQVAGILTSEQKATVQKVNDSVKQALNSALTSEQKEKLASVKKPKKVK